MDTRKPEGIHRDISLLGYGCMRFPLLEGTPEIDRRQAEPLLDAAYEQGVNYFDTAYGYHEGQSESFVGSVLKKYPRDTFCLATKMPGWYCQTGEDGPRIFEEQLGRCAVDYFDFYLCHAVSSREGFTRAYLDTGILDYLRREKERGRIRHFGFSFHGSVETLEWLTDRFPWDFVQLQLNYLDWNLQNARRQYEILQERRLPCIVMEPVRGGTLATLNPRAAGLLSRASPGRSVASWAIRFAASLPGVLSVLSGMGTLEQLRDNVNTLSRFEPLADAERTVLAEAAEAYLAAGTIPCTACRYCMDCPAGVDIPGVFRIYNQCATRELLPAMTGGGASSRDGSGFAGAFQALPAKAGPAGCLDCKQCVDRCPQSIPIPEKMHEIENMRRSVFVNSRD